MKRALSVALLLTCPVLTAQKDTITWTDGTVSRDVRVRDFTWREIAFSKSGSDESRSADAVAKLDVTKVRDKYKRAFAADSEEKAYREFMSVADELVKDDPFLAQWGYIEAARLHAKRGDYGEAFKVLEEMTQKLPDSGFFPELFRMKLDYYLAQGDDKAGNAGKVAQAYTKTAIEKGWPDGFVHEATYYELMARSASGALSQAAFIDELKSLFAKTNGAYPAVADRVQVQLAKAHLDQDEIDQAKKIYEQLIDKDAIDSNTRAQAMLGMGHTYFKTASRANEAAYRDALLMFLRVYLYQGTVAREFKAEALYHAAVSAEKWRGPDSAAMSRRLRGYLRRDYPDSPWATR